MLGGRGGRAGAAGVVWSGGPALNWPVNLLYTSGQASGQGLQGLLVTGVWCLVSGVWYLVSGVWCLVSGVDILKVDFFAQSKN